MSKDRYSKEKDMAYSIHIVENEMHLSEIEKKHLPVIKAPDMIVPNEPFEVNIHVGGIDGIEHPNELAHFIEWIELYAGDTFLGRCCFSGGASFPIAKFKVKLSHTHGSLKVWAKCNLHGLWENRKNIEIVS